MAETKRVSDQYSIISPIINIGDSSSSVTIDGNLTVTGTTTSVETTNSQISDNTIILNEGETGAGVTLGTSGIEIDRGSLNNVSFVYDDSIDAFKVFDAVTTNLVNLRAAEPVNASDVTTKKYVDDSLSSGVVGAAGVNTSVQYNSSGVIAGDTTLLWNGTSFTVGNTNISSNSITVDDTNGDLELSANGSGTIYTRSVVKMENETSDPGSVSGNNQLYAKAPGSGGTGLYFVNDTASGELVSKSKAIVFGIIF